MATDKSENQNVDSQKGDAGGGMSMKDRLIAQRRAAEAQQAGASAGSAPPVPAARPPQAAPRAAPQPAPQPTAPAKPAPAPAAKAAAPAPAARTAAPASKSAAPAAEAPKHAVKLSSQRAEERAQQADDRAARRGGGKQVSAEVQREVALLRKEQDKWITYGWIVAGALMLIAGVTYVIVKGKADARQSAYEATIKAGQDIVDKLKSLDINKEADANETIRIGEDPATKKALSEDPVGEHKAFVTSRVQQARAMLDRLKEKGDILGGLAEIEAASQSAASKPLAELEQLRRRASDYLMKSDLSGDPAAFKARLAKARVDIDRAYASRLREDARTAAGKGPGEARAALTAYTRAEDEVTKLLDTSVQNKNEEDRKFYSTLFQEIITESDALVAQIFTPDVIEKTPWIDLLSAENIKNWKDDGFKGFSAKDGAIHAVAKEPGTNVSGLTWASDRESLRDFVVEGEFVLIKGRSKFYFHLGRRVDDRAEYFEVATAGEAPFKPNQPYTYTASYIGSSFKYAFGDQEHAGAEDAARWTMLRKGPLAITVPEGGEVKITKMRIRVLR